MPLRTSVELFSDPGQPPAVVRAKEAAVLHDEVILEGGYLDVSLTEHGGLVFWTPPEQITQDMIQRARNPAPVGTPMSFGIGKQPARGVPATEMRTMIAGPIAAAYGAEWHSEVIDPLSELGVDWATVIYTPANDISREDPVGDAIYQQNFADVRDKTLLPSVNTFRRDFIVKSFNRDAAVAQDLGAVFQITTLFEPMVERHDFEPRPSGSAALSVLLPDLRRLSWESIAAFRQHDGATEARALMFEFERRALEEEPTDARDYLLKVSQQVTKALLGALRDKRTNVPKELAEEAVKTGISLIPVAGPFIEKGITVGQVAGDARAERRSGLAALMKLAEARP